MTTALAPKRDLRKRDPKQTGEWYLRKRARIVAGTPASCLICGFEAKSNNQLSAHIRWTHHIRVVDYYDRYEKNPCQQCGKKIPYAKSRPLSFGRMFCSNFCAGHSRKGPVHLGWKGGSLTGEGYRKVSIYKYPAEHHDILRPMATSIAHRNYVFEHRAVVAIAIGRSLKRSETVHHKNGDKLDNRPENLELFVSAHGVGVRASEIHCPHCGKAYA